jgi:hypothetical protein
MQPERLALLTNHLQFDLEKLLNNQYENWLLTVPESQSAISEALASIDPGLAKEFETFYSMTRLSENRLLGIIDTAQATDSESEDSFRKIRHFTH